MVLRRLVPHSMLSWFALVLVAGISLSLISVSAFHAFNRDEAVAALEDLRAAERIAAAARFLDHSAPPLRAVIAESISGSSLFIAATPASMIEESEPPDSRTGRLRDVIAARLLDMRWRELRVDYGIGPDDASHPLWSWLPSLWTDERKKTDEILSLQDQGQTFTVALQLMDGTWLNFSFASVKSLPFSSWSHLLALAAGIAAVMVLGVGAMRLITRPIESLAVAAEELGRGVRPGDVPETGLNEVRLAARAFNRMQRRIRRMIEDRTQMIAAISHDLRTPITRLRLRAEFVEDPEEQQKMLTDLDQMEAIIRSTLAFAREDSDTEPTEPVDLTVLLQDVADDHPPARLNGSAGCVLRARPVALRRCFNNLVENAIRYGNSAEIAIKDLADEVEVTVDDTGPGIPEGRFKDVFRPFVRLEESRNRDSGGAGLGLAIARSVVLAHGGTITLANRKEGGLRALVRLPKAG
ncbi:MAG TPA: ATP-binding protein [Dongiaceae bacterium]|jgi:signal transduction histidine kinase|nr:ATP-binding protein [Dongiaceae bacterium]